MAVVHDAVTDTAEHDRRQVTATSRAENDEVMATDRGLVQDHLGRRAVHNQRLGGNARRNVRRRLNCATRLAESSRPIYTTTNPGRVGPVITCCSSPALTSW